MRALNERRSEADPPFDGHVAAWLDRIVVRGRERTTLVRAEAIDCIESAGIYVALHVGNQRIVHRARLAELVARLDPVRFVRVHRSAVVNLDSVVHLEPASHGEFDLMLRHGHTVRLSRTFRPLLESRLGQSL